MILDEIAEYTRHRVAMKKCLITAKAMKEKALALPKKTFAFEKALDKEGISFICEVKKASPSKGIISEDFDYLKIAREYDKYGATCISVLTEPKYFLGDEKYLTEIKNCVSIPVLRKDFVVDEYMIYEARVIDADCVLLICSLLDKETLVDYIKIADSLGLSALVEAHDEAEIEMAISAGARIIGVNNRNLKTFDVDITNSGSLRHLVPEGVRFVAESGIKTRADVKALEDMRVDAVLVGETLMRSDDIKNEIRKLKGEVYE